MCCLLKPRVGNRVNSIENRVISDVKTHAEMQAQSKGECFVAICEETIRVTKVAFPTRGVENQAIVTVLSRYHGILKRQWPGVYRAIKQRFLTFFNSKIRPLQQTSLGGVSPRPHLLGCTGPEPFVHVGDPR